MTATFDTVTEWGIPLVSLLGFLGWALVFRDHHGHEPSTRYLMTLATILIVAVCLSVSALIYPGVVTSEGSRFANSVARFALLFGAVGAWWTGRPKEDA